MKIDAVLFDINGTLVDILTDDNHLGVFRKIRNFLNYMGIYTHKLELKELYFQTMKEQRAATKEEFPEFDSQAVWKKILELKHTDFSRQLPPEVLKSLPLMISRLYRSLTLCRKLTPYPDVPEVLEQLSKVYPLGIVSDAQTAYGLPELRAVNLAHYFKPIVISGDYGYRKPDKRIFQTALDALNVKAENTVFVGNDMYRDIYGPKQMGMKTVLFASNQGDKESRGAEPDYITFQFSQLPTALEFLKKNH